VVQSQPVQPQLLRQIVLNRQPHANDVDSVVFVPQEISYGAQLGPGNSGAQFLSRATEFPCRLADPFQTALYRIAGLEVLRESRQIHARREVFDQDDVF
jgi:hypothetical protein